MLVSYVVSSEHACFYDYSYFNPFYYCFDGRGAGLGCRTGTTQQTENNAFLRMLSATLDHADTDAAFGVAKRALSKRKKLLNISSK